MAYLSSRTNSAYLFPVVLGSVVVATALYSAIFLKEKIGRFGVVGILIGVMAIAVIDL